MRGETERASLDAPPGLAASILERTSGPACHRSRDLLCDLTDGWLEETDAELVGLHLEVCDHCSALARTLRQRHPESEAIEPDVHGFLAEMEQLGVLESAT